MTVPLKLWTGIGDSVTQGIDFGMTDTNNISGSLPSESGAAFETMVAAFKEALGEMKVEMDDEEMGKFVDKTVTSLVYS